MLALSAYKCCSVRGYGQVKEHKTWSEAVNLYGQHPVYIGSAEPSKVEDSIIFCLLIFMALFLMSAMRATGQARELFVILWHLLQSRPFCALDLIYTGLGLDLELAGAETLTTCLTDQSICFGGSRLDRNLVTDFCLCVCWVNWEMWVQTSIYIVVPLSQTKTLLTCFSIHSTALTIQNEKWRTGNKHFLVKQNERIGTTLLLLFKND